MMVHFVNRGYHSANLSSICTEVMNFNKGYIISYPDLVGQSGRDIRCRCLEFGDECTIEPLSKYDSECVGDT